ncbi:MFS transporter [Pantoea sp.]|uniref:MFS transporter n=1 Tax=Pantoea sp. TaxID=69393 RepID=UPI002897A0C6|nr:MFS transporter [Pantoea sp.]
MSQLNKAGAFTLLSVACLTIMVGCVIVPGLNPIAQQLGVAQAASWLITVPSLGVVVFGPLAGKAIDKTGAHGALRWGLFLYGLLGAGGVFLHGTIPVMLNRLLLGGATALVMASGTGLISTFYQGQSRLKMIARQGMSIELGGVIFLSIGGLLATAGWRWPFLLYLVAWLLLIMLMLFVPQPDKVGQGREENIALPPASGSLKIIWFAAVCSMICFFTGVIVIPQRFHDIGINAAQTGYFLSFISLVAVIAAFFLPRLLTLLSDKKTLRLAFLLYALAHLIFVFAATLPGFIAGGIAMGFGFGLSVPLVNHMTVEQSTESVRGRNLAWLAMAIFSGQFLSSFMEFIPGELSVVFGGAAIFALIALACLMPGGRAPAKKRK